MTTVDPVEQQVQLDSAERHLIARLAAHESWARTPNRTARTAPARNAFLAKFEDIVDPGGVLDSQERRRRAANARKAHFTRLALKSAQVRRGASSRRRALDELAEATALLAAVSGPGLPPVDTPAATTGLVAPSPSGGATR